MGILVAEIKKKSKLNCTRLLTEVYFTVSEIKFCSADIELLSYYLLWGATKGTDVKLKSEYYSHLSAKKANQAIYRTRSKLKAMGLLVQNVYTLDLAVRDDLLAVFEDATRLGAFLKFTYTDTDELAED